MILDPHCHQLVSIIEQYRAIDASQIAQEDPEVLHQLRVQARTLLSLLKKESESYSMIKAIIKQSNAIRDLDVFLNESLLALPQKVQQHLAAVLDQIRLEKDQLETQFKQQLTPDFLSRLCNALEIEFVHQKKSASSDTGHKHHIALPLIRSKLAKQQQLLLNQDIKSKKLHAIRLKIKKLRYQASHYYPEEKKLNRKLKFLQNHLGTIHDKDMCLQILNAHLLNHTDLRTEVTTVIRQQQEQTIQKIRSKL